MTGPSADWEDLLHGRRWRSAATVWVEDETEYSWEQVGELASRIEQLIVGRGGVRVAEIRSSSKLGAFAGQLAAWRAGCVAVANDGNLGAAELALVRPEIAVEVAVAPGPRVVVVERGGQGEGGQLGQLAPERIPAEVVAVNFTSGSTGNRRAVAVTAGNLLALFACRGLDVPARDGLTAGSFATPAFDGWWFDTWKTVAAGGTVVCLPNVNEDIFAWPELAKRYLVDRVLLPAAVVATLVEVAPQCLADIPWIFSGGEQFQAATYRQARAAGLTNRFVNLYGPTEATFATHKYDLPEELAGSAIPIGRVLDGCRQRLDELGDAHETGDGSRELVVRGPFVCLGYIEDGALARRFLADDGDRDRYGDGDGDVLGSDAPGAGEPTYRTGDRVRVDEDGNLVFAGRLDHQIKVNGIRVDVAALEERVADLTGVLDCRVVQSAPHTVAFARVDAGTAAADPALRSRVEALVRTFSAAIGVELVDRFPVKSGGKVDTASLMNLYRPTDQGGRP